MLFWTDACKGFSGQAVFWASSGLGQVGFGSMGLHQFSSQHMISSVKIWAMSLSWSAKTCSLSLI